MKLRYAANFSFNTAVLGLCIFSSALWGSAKAPAPYPDCGLMQKEMVRAISEVELGFGQWNVAIHNSNAETANISRSQVETILERVNASMGRCATKISQEASRLLGEQSAIANLMADNVSHIQTIKSKIDSQDTGSKEVKNSLSSLHDNITMAEERVGTMQMVQHNASLDLLLEHYKRREEILTKIDGLDHVKKGKDSLVGRVFPTVPNLGLEELGQKGPDRLGECENKFKEGRGKSICSEVLKRQYYWNEFLNKSRNDLQSYKTNFNALRSQVTATEGLSDAFNVAETQSNQSTGTVETTATGAGGTDGGALTSVATDNRGGPARTQDDAVNDLIAEENKYTKKDGIFGTGVGGGTALLVGGAGALGTGVIVAKNNDKKGDAKSNKNRAAAKAKEDRVREDIRKCTGLELEAVTKNKQGEYVSAQKIEADTVIYCKLKDGTYKLAKDIKD